VISVIIPVRNHEAFVAEAVESVRRQTLRPAEIVVIDDGSEDESAARAEAAGARVVRIAHAGLSTALNRGIAETTHPLLAFLDADDVWLPDKLERQVAALGDADAVFGWAQEFSDTSARLRTLPGFTKGAMLVRRDALERVGGFDPRWAIGDFIDWFARAQERGLRHVMLDDIVVRRRVHDANLARNRQRDYGDYLRILKASLDRRRAAGVTPPGDGVAQDDRSR
jgi:glycosyltransferase involved in cell wall biosynthesis